MEIWAKLEEYLPDLICLQGLSKIFLDELLHAPWLRENSYSLLVKAPAFEQSNGQLVLMKRFRPSNYSIDHAQSSGSMQVQFALDKNDNKIRLLYAYGSNYQIPEALRRTIEEENYLIIGHFNDDHLITYPLVDLRKEYEALDEMNEFARLSWNQSVSSSCHQSYRDRFLFHKLFNLKYSIEQMKQWGPAVSQLLIQLEIRSMNAFSALAIVPSEKIGAIITLISPFFHLNHTDDDVDSILLPLRLYLSRQEQFNLQSDLWRLEQLQTDIQQLFLPFQLAAPSLASVQSTAFMLPVQELSIVQFDQPGKNSSYIITHQIPLGSILQPLDPTRSDQIHPDLAHFFSQMNLYPEPIAIRRKQEKFVDLSNSIDRFFMSNPMECFNYELLAYGSHRLVRIRLDARLSVVKCTVHVEETRQTTNRQCL